MQEEYSSEVQPQIKQWVPKRPQIQTFSLPNVPNCTKERCKTAGQDSSPAPVPGNCTHCAVTIVGCSLRTWSGWSQHRWSWHLAWTCQENLCKKRPCVHACTCVHVLRGRGKWRRKAWEEECYSKLKFPVMPSTLSEVLQQDMKCGY